jgi:myo-inositol-1(or 4)-monophosphatase
MAEPIEDVADRAVRAGGEYALSQFDRDGNGDEDADAVHGTDDVKSAVDREAERRILSTIRAAYPEHAVVSEERGELHGEGAYEWVVDPLDGTNNFVAGLPMFASAVFVRDGTGPYYAAIHEPLLGNLYSAKRGRGAALNGEPVTADSDLRLAQSTVGFVVGLEAVRDPDQHREAVAVRERIEERCKRVLQSWAPCIDWTRLARGSMGAVVAYRPDDWDYHAGALLAREAGARVYDPEDGPVCVYATDTPKRERLCEAVEAATDPD